MQSGTRDYVGRNQMLTPPAYSIYNQLKTDADEGLWTQTSDGTAIEPIDDVNVTANLFKCYTNNKTLNSDNNNLVTAGYVKEYVEHLNDDVLVNYMDQDECDARYVQKSVYEPTISTINSNIADLDSKTSNIQTQITTLNADVNNLSDKTNVLETDVVKNTSDINSLNDRTSIVENEITTKANSSDVYIKTETYSQSEVNELISEVQAGITTDLSNYYTKPETDDEIVKITKTEFTEQEIDHYEQQTDEDGNPMYDENGNPIMIPVYKDIECENKDLWDTKTGAKMFECADKHATSITKRILGRIFIDPWKKRIRTACLAACGALVGTKVVAETVAFGTTAAVNIKELGGDDDPGEIDFEDDYHGNRTVTNIVHDNEYNSMTYIDENSNTVTLDADSTIPTTLAIKNHHYTKEETDAKIINAIDDVQVDLSDYYTKEEVDVLVDSKVGNVKTLIKDDNLSKVLLSNKSITYNSSTPYEVKLNSFLMNANKYSIIVTAEFLEDEISRDMMVITLTIGSKVIPLDFKTSNSGKITYTASEDLNFNFGTTNEVWFKIKFLADELMEFTVFTLDKLTVTYNSVTEINNYYTQPIIDSKLNDINNSIITSFSNYYNKSEIDSKIADIDTQIDVINYEINNLSNIITETSFNYTSKLPINSDYQNPTWTGPWHDIYAFCFAQYDKDEYTMSEPDIAQPFTAEAAYYKFNLRLIVCQDSDSHFISVNDMTVNVGINENGVKTKYIFPCKLSDFMHADLESYWWDNKTTDNAFTIECSGEFSCTPGSTIEIRLATFKHVNPEYTWDRQMNYYTCAVLSNGERINAYFNGTYYNSKYFYFKGEIDNKLSSLEARIAALESK